MSKDYQVGDKTFHVHLDGYNLIPFFKGEVKESPRNEFLCWSDDGDLFAVRIKRWKMVFKNPSEERRPSCYCHATETAWWHDYVVPYGEIRWIRKKLKFEGMKDTAPFAVAIFIFRPQIKESVREARARGGRESARQHVAKSQEGACPRCGCRPMDSVLDRFCGLRQ
jgi:hypothetical protein